jgi:PKD repeat protein
VTARRLATSAALALAILAGASAVAVADDEIVATVLPSGTQSSAALSALVANCVPLYAGPQLEQYGPGEILEPETTITEAWTVATVLGCLSPPIPLSSVTAITIVGAIGPELGPDSLLTPADLATPSDFANTGESPVIGSDGDGLEYARPWRGSGDPNAGDAVQLNAGEQFDFEVFTGPTVTVALAAPSSSSASTATPLSATVSGAPSGLSYAWSFDGGTGTDSGASTAVTFAAPGTYVVTVQATDAAGGVGVAAATISVGSQTSASSTGPATGPVTGTGTSPGAPPTRKRRARKRKPSDHARRPAAVKQATSPPLTPSTTTTRTAPPPRPATTQTAPPPRPATTQTTPQTAPQTTPQTTTASPPKTARTAPISHHDIVSRTVRREPADRHRAPDRRRVSVSSTRASPRAARVAGRLLGSLTAIPADRSPLVHEVPAAAATAPALRRLVEPSVIPALAAGFGVVLLFALGAARELRWRRLRSRS